MAKAEGAGKRPGTDVATIVESSVSDDSPAPERSGRFLHPTLLPHPMGRDGPDYNSEIPPDEDGHGLGGPL